MYTGIHQGELFRVAPRNRKVVYAGAAIYRFGDDRIADGWVLGDTLSLMRQIGAVPLA